MTENDDATLRDVDQTWNELRLRSDTAGLALLMTDDWMLAHSDGRAQDKAEYLEELRSGRRTNERIVNEDLRIRRYGDTAVITGISVQGGQANGEAWHGRYRFTRVWVRRGDSWIMVSSHSSKFAAAG